MKNPFSQRLAAGLFFVLLGVVLGVFTAFDVGLHYLARKRRAGFGARPLVGTFWHVLLAPTRRAFWSIGFWVALGALAVVAFRILLQVESSLTAAGLP